MAALPPPPPGFILEGATGPTAGPVNGVGKSTLHQDYGLKADGTAAPIPGTPTAQVLADKALAQAQAVEQLRRQAAIADDLSTKAGGFNSGFLGWGPGMIPGTGAYDYKHNMDAVKSNVALKALADLKASGASLGRVTNMEMGLLQSKMGSLDPGQSAGQLSNNLNAVRDNINSTLQAMGAGRMVRAQRSEVDALRQNPTMDSVKAFNMRYGPGAGEAFLRDVNMTPKSAAPVDRKVIHFNDLP